MALCRTCHLEAHGTTVDLRADGSGTSTLREEARRMKAISIRCLEAHPIRTARRVSLYTCRLCRRSAGAASLDTATPGPSKRRDEGTSSLDFFRYVSGAFPNQRHGMFLMIELKFRRSPFRPDRARCEGFLPFGLVSRPKVSARASVPVPKCERGRLPRSYAPTDANPGGGGGVWWLCLRRCH